MSALFDSYEAEYTNLCVGINDKIDKLATLTGDKRKHTIHVLEREIDEATSTLTQMDMEARTLDPRMKQICADRVKQYRSELADTRGEFKRAKSSAAGDRASLLGGATGHSTSSASGDQRERMAAATASLQASSARLEESRRVALQTEDVGVNILQNLSSQRETMMRSRERLEDADQSISQSKTVLNSMTRRIATQKMLLVGIAVLMVVIIGIVLVVKFSGESPVHAGDSEDGSITPLAPAPAPAPAPPPLVGIMIAQRGQQ